MPRTIAFSTKQAFQFGWAAFKRYSFFLMGITFFAILVYILPAFVSNKLKQEDISIFTFVFFAVLGLAYVFLQYIVQLGYLNISLIHMRGKKAAFDELFACIPRVILFLFATILYQIITMVGFVLLIVPGVIWGIQFQFSPFFIIDKKMSVLQSFAASDAITKGAKVDLLIFNICMRALNMLGAVALGIGLLVTLPVTAIALAKVYQTLLERKNNRTRAGGY